jgi:transcriptional regulator with XRE-family HTH domain
MNEHEKVLMTQVGRNVERLRAERGMSLDQLAGASSVGRQQIERLVRAEGHLLVDDLFLLAAALRVAPEALLNGIDWIPDEDGGGGEYRVEGPD